MRKLIAATMLSLNGSATNQGQWTTGYFDDEAKQAALASLAESDLFLLGRKTYEQFAPRWSKVQGDAYFDAINAMPKAVCSRTLSSVSWNATLLRGDPVEEVRALRAQDGKQIVTYGITTLTRSLLMHQLVDELRFWVHPTIADGERVFDGFDASGIRLELIECNRHRSGVVQFAYLPRYM